MEIKELQGNPGTRRSLEAELECLHQTANELHARIRQEQLHLEYEQADVQELETPSVKTFFYTVLGKKEERLQKEQDEAEEAKRQYEATVGELERVNARIKRVEFELRTCKQAEAEQNKRVREILAKLQALGSKLSDVDALTFSALQKEYAGLEKRRSYYAQIQEAGNELRKRHEWTEQAERELREERYKSRYGTTLAEYELWDEIRDRKGVVAIQERRIGELLQALVQETAANTSGGTLPKDRLTVLGNNVADNLSGILAEVDERDQNARLCQANLERRLSELLQKYQNSEPKRD